MSSDYPSPFFKGLEDNEFMKPKPDVVDNAFPDAWGDLDSDMNKEGVPLDEFEAGGIWRGLLSVHGVYSVRIENIGLSMPDTVLVYKGLIWFNEMKVRRGNYIYMPIYQLPSYIRLGEHLRRWQIAYVVFSTGHFNVYDFAVIKAADPEPTNSGKVRIRITDLPMIMAVNDSYSAKEYLDWVTDKAFKKKT